MKKRIGCYVIILNLICFSFFLNCLSKGSGDSVRVIIDLGFSYQERSESVHSVFEYLLQIFTRDLFAQTAPSNIESLNLTISASDMNTIEESYAPVPESIEIEVSVGSAREFVIIANTPSATLRGSSTVDLTAEEDVNITISMNIYETKFIVPDEKNYRIIQIDDISGNGWVSKTGTDLNLTSISIANFMPNDIDFDSRGRIYIANGTGNAADDYVIRIDDITDTNPEAIIVQGLPIQSLTVDRNNSYLYYATSSLLYRSTLEGTGNVNLTITNGVDQIQTIRGMSVDADGILYIAGVNTEPAQRVFKYNPTSQNVDASYSSNLNSPCDTLIKDGTLYVANTSAADGYKILQLNRSLQLSGQYGNQSASADSVPGNFYGPKMFIAILNRNIYFIDEGSINEPSGFEGDRLVEMEDILGSSWQTFGSTGVGDDQFRFYWAC